MRGWQLAHAKTAANTAPTQLVELINRLYDPPVSRSEDERRAGADVVSA
jgi:hypothetical protein